MIEGTHLVKAPDSWGGKNMQYISFDQTTKLYDRKNFQSSMMILDQSRSKNNENYQVLYQNNTPDNTESIFEDEQDVKIWIPVSSRI